MAKTKFEEMYDRLPPNMKETEVLRLSTKKVLAALLELLLHSKARESRVIYCQNARLRKFSGVSSNDLLPSIQQLIDYGLITRRVGAARKEGETKGEASEYTINMKKLKEPLVEKSFDDLFGEFLDDTESYEKPINTAITTTTTIPNSIATASSTAMASSTDNIILINNNNLLDNINNNIIDNNINSTISNSNINNNFNNKILLNKNNKILYNNILEENPSDKESNNPKTMVADTTAVLDSCLLDPEDFKEDFTFIEELNKRIAYHRWANEE